MKKLFLVLALVLVMGQSAAATHVYQWTGTSTYIVTVDSSVLPIDSVWAEIRTFVGAYADTAIYASPGVILKWPAYYKASDGTTLKDSTQAWVRVLASSVNDSVQPSVVVHWIDAQGYDTKEPVQFGPPTAVLWADTVGYVWYVDTVQTVVDTVKSACTGGGGGTGSGPNADTILVWDSVSSAAVEGAQFIIHSVGGVPETEWLTTDVNGKRITYLAAGNWRVYVNTPGYFQSGFEAITNAGDQLDTVYVYTPVLNPLPASDSCLMVVFTDVPYARGEFTPNSQKFQNLQGTFLNSKTQARTAAANGIMQISLPKTDSTVQKTTWHIKVLGEGGRYVIADIPEYVVPTQSVDTVRVEE